MNNLDGLKIRSKNHLGYWSLTAASKCIGLTVDCVRSWVSEYEVQIIPFYQISSDADPVFCPAIRNKDFILLCMDVFSDDRWSFEIREKAYAEFDRVTRLSWHDFSDSYKETYSVEGKKQSVYVITCKIASVLKIGISRDPVGRLRQIQTGYPHKLELDRVIECEDAKSLEKQIHRSLESFRLEGEWFNLNCLSLIDAEILPV